MLHQKHLGILVMQDAMLLESLAILQISVMVPVKRGISKHIANEKPSHGFEAIMNDG
jgi:hypothetical protein